MGGRGKGSVAKYLQINDEEVRFRFEVLDVIQKSEQRRQTMMGEPNIGPVDSIMVQNRLRKCACCGEYTIPVNTRYVVCPNCGWVDDENQNNNPDSIDGKNPISLIQARANYLGRRGEV